MMENLQIPEISWWELRTEPICSKNCPKSKILTTENQLNREEEEGKQGRTFATN